jgi:hypothetical protein
MSLGTKVEGVGWNGALIRFGGRVEMPTTIAEVFTAVGLCRQASVIEM